MLFSVVVCTWKRYEEINEVVSYYKKYTDDIVIWDNGGSSDEHIVNKDGILIIKPSKNVGSCSKFKAVAFTKNDNILITDDDIVPKNGLVEDMVGFSNKKYCDLFALFGRKFPEGGGYNHDEAQRVRSKDITEPTKVDFLGVLYFGKREFFTMDFKNTQSVYDDVMLIFLQNKIKQNLSRYIFPTKNYRYTKDMIGKYELCNQPEFYSKRDKLAKAIYRNDTVVIENVLRGGDV